MALFGGDKEAKQLREQLKEVRAIYAQTQALLEDANRENAELRDRLKGLQPQSPSVLLLVRWVVRCLGVALLISSAFLAHRLLDPAAAARLNPEWGLVALWSAYLFCQSAGLMLLAFAPTRSHSHLLLFGTYMTVALLVFSVLFVMSFRGGDVPATANLAGLMVFNAFGVWLLVRAEKVLGARALTTSMHLQTK